MYDVISLVRNGLPFFPESKTSVSIEINEHSTYNSFPRTSHKSNREKEVPLENQNKPQCTVTEATPFHPISRETRPHRGTFLYIYPPSSFYSK
ncbi:hypothetical protein CEXT_517441 [Caerostris extrusa]|uniref:Uncharacterized protein n=1 Tax=Caerostris extrusa TaxID=172846 RepID=A0AAV4W6Q7_CAEEX|nr:hypothetical protein CEXT_517441 [Caerostris extrusa]